MTSESSPLLYWIAAQGVSREVVESWYNRQRRHSTLGSAPPTEYEALAQAVAIADHRPVHETGSSPVHRLERILVLALEQEGLPLPPLAERLLPLSARFARAGSAFDHRQLEPQP